MISYQEWLQELIPFTGNPLLTREQYYKKHCPQGSPLQLYNFLVENVSKVIIPKKPTQLEIEMKAHAKIKGTIPDSQWIEQRNDILKRNGVNIKT